MEIIEKFYSRDKPTKIRIHNLRDDGALLCPFCNAVICDENGDDGPLCEHLDFRFLIDEAGLIKKSLEPLFDGFYEYLTQLQRAMKTDALSYENSLHKIISFGYEHIMMTFLSINENRIFIWIDDGVNDPVQYGFSNVDFI
jgi:hypothetical protein